MKTSILAMALAFISIASFGQNSYVDYVITNTDTIICKDLTIRNNTAKCILNSGEKVIVPMESIISYSNNGRIMKKLPVYHYGIKTDKFAMMEFVANYNRVEVYQYVYFDGLYNSFDVVYSFYNNQECINTKTNPDRLEIKNYLLSYKQAKNGLLTAE